ncbi:MAG TPA: energy transducer TonB [Candidatus Cybelea sp.]|nr:energy transducer TonB [Candidatus Cybelea sp.]
MNDLGNLGQCMMDSDSDARRRARRLRQRAILISIGLEAICLAAMLMWPLATIGVLPGYSVMPLQPYRGGGGRIANQPRHRSNINHRFPLFTGIVFERPRSSNSVPSNEEKAAPEIGIDPGSGSGPGPAGPLIPGGFEHPPRIEPPRQPAVRMTPRRMVSEGVMAGALVRRLDPAYPEAARAMHLSGIVRLRAIISTDGTIEHLELLSGNPILARAAEQAVLQWRYRPTLLSGVPVEVETYITVNFVLGP